MSLPNYLKNNQSGQVLVIFLLVLVIGLALVLSIASRTVTDIRQTTTSDESNRAYFAAESGVEDALKRIEEDPVAALGSKTLDLTGVNRTSADVEVTALSAPADTILDFLEYEQDDVAQINLLNDFNNLAGGSGIATGDSIILHYGKEGTSATSATAPALEVSFISHNAGTWQIRKMTFDPNTGRSNGFCKGTGSPVASTNDHRGYAFSARIKLDGPGAAPTSPACAINSDQGVVANPVIARVRFLYGSSPLGVEAVGKALPQQGQKVFSTGETPSGVSRKLEVTRFYPTMPAIFDYVLYNGSSGDLCKGSC